MQVTNIDNFSFRGGFRFINMPDEARVKLVDLSKKGKQVFYDFENKGDVFLVTRDNLNFKVGKFINEHNLKFEFYPQINTNCGLDNEIPEALSKLLKSMNIRPITTKSQLKKVLSMQNSVKDQNTTSPQYVQDILEGLHIVKDLKYMNIKGVYVFNDPEFERKIHISKPLANDMFLVLVEPYSSSKPSKRFLTDIKGNIVKVFKTPDEIHKFYNDFRNSI